LLPNFLIVGAQKSGTTALHYLLRAHPEVFFPPDRNEVHFFDLDENFEKGLEWYESLFDTRQREVAVGECSPFYMFEPAAAPRFKRILSDVKLLVILRDPVARAYSHYWHEVRYGFEALSFEEAIDEEANRLRSGSVHYRRHYSYVARGHYSSQIARLIDLFGRDQILVLLNEELSLHPGRVGRAAAEFLSVDPDGIPDDVSNGGRPNAARLPRSRKLQRMRPVIESVWPRLCGVLDWLNLVDKRYPAMPERIRDRLRREFSAEPRLLREFTGVDVSEWWPIASPSDDG